MGLNRLLNLAFALGLAIVVAADCNLNGNNCARAVSATREGPVVQASHRADCSSFFSVTVTPATSTVYTTLTSTPATVTTTVTTVTSLTTITDSTDTQTIVVTSTLILIPQKRGVPDEIHRLVDLPSPPAGEFYGQKRAVGDAVTVTPTQVPTYASACANPAAYSSACSCWGIYRQTTTLPTPTTTMTVSTSVTQVVSTSASTDVTVSTTATTFVTTTTVATSVTCPATVRPSPLAAGFCGGCNYEELCEVTYDTSNPNNKFPFGTTNLQGCVNFCDRYTDCYAYLYNRLDGNCVLFSRLTPITGPNAAPGMVVGKRLQGSCPTSSCLYPA